MSDEQLAQLLALLREISDKQTANTRFLAHLIAGLKVKEPE